jgi:hypothetical protein
MFERGVPRRGHPDRAHGSAGAQDERDHGALGGQRAA